MNTLKHALALAGALATCQALAGQHSPAGTTQALLADDHAPIGVMGDHLHEQGEWMLSYRYMRMAMEDNLQGDDAISPDEIVTRVANPNAPPPTVRVVPEEMTMDMHMFGMMYAPTDDVTLVLMLNYLEKSMDHITYRGMMGTERLGEFSTGSSGLGDSKISALWRLHDAGVHHLHLNLGLSLPTGSIDEEDRVLTPMNTRPTLRMPYAMQLGSGTWDLEPGFTYTGREASLGWGAQYLATLRLGENDEDYTLGDRHQLTGWGSYRLVDWASLSLRLAYLDEDDIDGSDPAISAAVTTANPDSYGGERLDLGLGVNLVGLQGGLRGHRLAIEYQTTLDQDANGVQMEMQSMLTLGYQYAF